jgi:hypothetical protein
MNSITRFTLRADAIFDAAFGVLMLLSPWIRGIFNLLDLPNPSPEVFTQFCGGLLLVCAYLLWLSPGDQSLSRPVARAIGLVNAAGVLLLGGWLTSGDLGVGATGSAILGVACLILVFFAVLELRFAS